MSSAKSVQSPINLFSEKIILRDWIIEDLPTYHHWMRPGHSWQELDGPYYQSKEDQSEAIIKDLTSKIQHADFPAPRMRLVIADKNTNQLIGTVSSYWESIETNWLCIGISIYDPNHWGKGIGFAAMTLWIDYLFNTRPEIVRLDFRTWSGNTGMMKLALKLGFSQEACFRQARIVKGQYYDGLGYGILRNEWKTK
jgi:RimJ/RimL family protein N-acetyltransferase